MPRAASLMGWREHAEIPVEEMTRTPRQGAATMGRLTFPDPFRHGHRGGSHFLLLPPTRFDPRRGAPGAASPASAAADRGRASTG